MVDDSCEGDYVQVEDHSSSSEDGAVKNRQFIRSLSSRSVEFRRSHRNVIGRSPFNATLCYSGCGDNGDSANERWCGGICEAFKYLYSTALLIFSVAIVMALIYQRQTKLAQDWSPTAAFLTMVFAIVWLNMVEGSQGAFVGLPPVERSLYQHTHPVTYKCTTIAHHGNQLERYIIGRQFLVVVIVFCTNFAGAPHHPDVTVFGFPRWLQELFLDSGVAMILMTAMAGQLNSQVTASQCMLDYVNTYFALFTLYVSLAIEWSGLLHAVYLVQMLFSKVTGKPIESQEAPRTGLQCAWFWARIVFSLTLLGLSFFVTLTALFQGQTTMWDGVPKVTAVVMFFVLMSLVGMLEGMQIAFFAVAKLSTEERGLHPVAIKTCELLFENENNLPAFMIGRQICVTLCFFVIARVTSLDIDFGDETFMGVSENFQEFLNTGLLGALITTIVGSIAWQLVASSFPLTFLSNPLVYILLRWCLLLEASGICSGAWVLADVYKRVMGFQKDEVYIGTAKVQREVATTNDGAPLV